MIYADIERLLADTASAVAPTATFHYGDEDSFMGIIKSKKAPFIFVHSFSSVDSNSVTDTKILAFFLDVDPHGNSNDVHNLIHASMHQLSKNFFSTLDLNQDLGTLAQRNAKPVPREFQEALTGVAVTTSFTIADNMCL